MMDIYHHLHTVQYLKAPEKGKEHDSIPHINMILYIFSNLCSLQVKCAYFYIIIIFFFFL